MGPMRTVDAPSQQVEKGQSVTTFENAPEAWTFLLPSPRISRRMEALPGKTCFSN